MTKRQVAQRRAHGSWYRNAAVNPVLPSRLPSPCRAIRFSAATESPLTVAPVASSLEIPATLLKPDGEGPFPAIVIMHDCSGLGPRSSGAPWRWSRDLVEQGYVVLIPDSFSPRGFADG